MRSIMQRTQPEGSRSGPGDTDRTLHSLRLFLHLATAGKPSILICFWAPVTREWHDLTLETRSGRQCPVVVSGCASPLHLLRDHHLHLLGDHNPPHYHAIYGEHEAWIVISNTEVLRGGLPTRALRLVRTWHRLHQAELEAAWQKATAGQAPGSIEPLP